LSSESTKHLIGLVAMKTSMDVSEIRPPLGVASYTSRMPAKTNPFLSANLWEGFPVILIVVAALIFLLTVGGILYLCVIRGR